LAVIVERATRTSFAEVLEARVFEHLGMARSVVRDRPDVVIPDRAIGYQEAESGGGWDRNDDHPLNWMVGAGGVYSTLDDFFLWDQALHSEVLVSRGTLEEAFTPTLLTDGSVSEYGFGWGLEDRLGQSAVSHTGSWVGFQTAIIRFIDVPLTVAVLTNARETDADDLTEQVARLYLAGEGR